MFIRLVLGILTATTLLAASSGEAFAHPAHRGHGAEAEGGLYISPAHLFAGTLSVGYEHTLSEEASMYLAGHLHGASYDVGSLPAQEGSYGVTIQPHLYLLRHAPRGPYVAPFAMLERMTIEGGGRLFTENNYMAGGTVGWAWILGHLSLKLGVGMGYGSWMEPIQVSGNGMIVERRQQIVPAADFKMGLVF